VEVAFADGVAAFDLANQSTTVLTRGHDRNSAAIEVPFAAPLRRELKAFVRHVAGLAPTPKAAFSDGVDTVCTIEHLRELAGVDRALPQRN
jgi:predicted dehydrogenase